MFDPTKPVQTRSGKPARILCTDRKYWDGTRPLVALVSGGDGEEQLGTYPASGRFLDGGSDDPDDLVNVPEQTKTYRYIDDEGCFSIFASFERNPGRGHIGLVTVTREGDEVVDVRIEDLRD